DTLGWLMRRLAVMSRRRAVLSAERTTVSSTSYSPCSSDESVKSREISANTSCWARKRPSHASTARRRSDMHSSVYVFCARRGKGPAGGRSNRARCPLHQECPAITFRRSPQQNDRRAQHSITTG